MLITLLGTGKAVNKQMVTTHNPGVISPMGQQPPSPGKKSMKSSFQSVQGNLN